MNDFVLKMQEIPFSDPRSTNMFVPTHSKPFVATRHALDVLGESLILESFRELHTPAGPSRLISMKVPDSLLTAFKIRCRLEDLRYQTQIKRLMQDWLEG